MKNNIKGKSIICIILIATLLAISANVYASDSFKTTLSTNSSSAKRGENITVTIGLKDIAIESGENGIGAYTANIDFDSSVLEYVETSGTDKWEAPLYQNKSITGCVEDGKVVNTAQNIGTIKFKVKEDAKLGETTIKLTKFSGSNAVSDVTASDSTITITILDKNNENQNDDQSQNGDESQSGGQNQSEGGSQSGEQNQNGGGSQSGEQNQNGGGSQSSDKNQNGNGNQSGDKNQNGDGSQNNNDDQSGNDNKDENLGEDNSNKNEGTNNSTNKGNTDKENIKQGKLPQTGHSDIIIYILITIMTLIAITFLIKIKLLNKRK